MLKGECPIGKYGRKNVVSLNPLDYNISLLGESGIGKGQPVDSIIPTPTGDRRIGDIKSGDYVFGSNGLPTKVRNVYDRGELQTYKVIFNDNSNLIVDEDHLWLFKRNPRPDRILRTKDLITHGVSHDYHIPLVHPLQYDDDDLEISPYLLGLYLADGYHGDHSFDISTKNPDIGSYLYELDPKPISSRMCGDVPHYYYTHTNGTLLRTYLEKVGLAKKKSAEKFIPHEIFLKSERIRKELLTGMFDGDGSLIHKNNKLPTLAYHSISLDLIKDLARLITSLGAVARWRTIKDDKGDYYQLTTSLPFNPFLHNTYKDKWKLNTRYLKRTFESVEPQDKSFVRCIEVEAEDNLYVADTQYHIVTHNTTIIKEVCEKLVGDDGYLFLDIGKEDGAGAINGLFCEPIYDWSKFDDVVTDIVENKTTEYPDLKVVVVDTYDELCRLAEAESLRQYNRKNSDNKADTINSAWGGFGKGLDKAIDLMLDALWELKKVGVRFIIIAHTKKKDVVDTMSEEDYSILTSNVSQKYWNAIKTKLHIGAMAFVDRQITKEKTGRKNIVTKKDILKGKVTEESRVISFRDDSYSVDSKSRFANIVDRIEFSSDAFIKAIQDAILAEQGKSGVSLDDAQKKQASDEKVASEAAAEYSKSKKENKVDIDRNNELFDLIKSEFPEATTRTKNKVKKIMAEHGIESFKAPDELPTAALEKIAELLQ